MLGLSTAFLGKIRLNAIMQYNGFTNGKLGLML